MTHARFHSAVHTPTTFARRLAPLAIAAFLLPGLATPAPAAASMSVAQRRESVLDATNDARKAAGCRPLVASKRLKSSAQAHAKDMAKNHYVDHTSADGRSWADRIRAAGYDKPGAENIAGGITSPRAVVAAWLNSPAHRHNIETCKLKKIGVGYSGGMWVQDFGF